MEETQSFRFFNRGPSPAVRLVFFSLLSLLLLFVDARYKYLGTVRDAVSVLTYPLQRLVAAPGELWHQANNFLVLQGTLVHDNGQLRRQHTVDAAQLQQYQAVLAENQHLRDLLGVQQRAGYTTRLAEIVYAERDIFRRKIYLNKGAQAGIQAGQVVADDIGVVGQVTHVYPWLSEVTLITDKDHAVPVQVLRNGLRTVVFGSGDISELTLRYITSSADIQVGDMLVTSGIDGTYPPGLPVARVSQIERDPAYPFARITCTPVAGVDRQRQLLILSSPPKLPERPEDEAATGADKPQKGRRKKP